MFFEGWWFVSFQRICIGKETDNLWTVEEGPVESVYNRLDETVIQAVVGGWLEETAVQGGCGQVGDKRPGGNFIHGLSISRRQLRHYPQGIVTAFINCHVADCIFLLSLTKDEIDCDG